MLEKHEIRNSEGTRKKNKKTKGNNHIFPRERGKLYFVLQIVVRKETYQEIQGMHFFLSFQNNVLFFLIFFQYQNMELQFLVSLVFPSCFLNQI